MRPGVTVVIPTKDRPRLLARCLSALAEQSLPPSKVVVVDDGSSNSLQPVIDRFTPTLPVQLIVHRVSTGPATARNQGWRAAETDYVAFTDDDCRPDPRWLERLREQASPDRIAVGQTKVDPDDGPLTSVFDRTFVARGLNWGYSTCNVLYPRDLIEAVGGFDEEFPKPWAEDTDLAYRAMAQGAAAVYVPEGVVFHAVHRQGVAATVRERWRTGQVVRLLRRHPELRQEAYDGWFWKPYHRHAISAALGIALTPLSPVFLLIAVPWIEEARRSRFKEHLSAMPGGAAAWTRQLAGLALLDSVEVASCAWFSARERTLLL